MMAPVFEVLSLPRVVRSVVNGARIRKVWKTKSIYGILKADVFNVINALMFALKRRFPLGNQGNRIF